ncbi:TonB-dependent receptor plug domain-containing protein [Gluconobacter sp. R75690]|uniref:TonB-dependent siderophore receptor n=1 Tax=Gluconobacter TaxID=441 RepID=UPI001889D56E|nr:MULTISPECIES: TonB-dependent receptor plug domain-containing protein [unclassified Gluconobacter]MBF0850972.1 TonB-dependent receptor plug domain-containing protein [Gluconobacter sp. R75690]MBF0879664.1 TonB-dependent receptor plug domain-containing protein [Gluconobacter sp. R75828]
MAEVKMSISLLKRNVSLYFTAGLLGVYVPAHAAETQTLQGGIRQVSDTVVVLPRQPLKKTVSEISLRMHVPVTIGPEVPDTVYAAPVKSRIAAEALQQALVGTDYTIYTDKAGAVYIRPANRENMNVRAKRNEAESQYNVDSSASSTRTGGSVRDLPQSSRTITSALMADQQIQTVADAMRNASGMTVNKSNLQGANGYTVRGWTATGMTNGMLDPTGPMQPVANVERVEVLKGPAALLSGGDNLGGSVNIVTKKPTSDPLLNIEGMYGSYDDRKITVDGSDALNHDKTLSARIVGDFADQDRTWAGYKGRKEYSIAPSLRFKNRSVDITVGVENSKVRQPQTGYAVIQAPGDDPQIVTYGHAFGPDNQGIDMWNTRWFYEATWNINHWLTFVSRSHLSNTTTLVDMYGTAAYEGNNNYLIMQTIDKQVSSQQANDDYLRAKFKTFNVKHTISTGMNYSQYMVSDYGADATDNNVFTVGPLNSSTHLAAFQPANTFEYRLGTRQLGFYGQDLIEYGRFHFFGAIRHTSYRSWGNNSAPVTIGKITPIAGVVIDLTKQVSIYGSWVKGFTPNYSIGTDNKLLPSQTTTNFEAGVKAQFFKKKLDLVASVYRLDQSNYSVLAAGYTNRYTVLPGMRTQGVDIDLSGTILPGWQISGSFTYAGFKFLSNALQKYIVPAQPKIKYSLYTSYVIQDGMFKRAGMAFGVYGNSSSSASSYYPKYTLGSQHEIDLNFFYTYRKMKFNFGITNLENRNIYGVSSTSTYISVNGPRMFRGTMSYSFF